MAYVDCIQEIDAAGGLDDSLDAASIVLDYGYNDGFSDYVEPFDSGSFADCSQPIYCPVKIVDLALLDKAISRLKQQKENAEFTAAILSLECPECAVAAALAAIHYGHQLDELQARRDCENDRPCMKTM